MNSFALIRHVVKVKHMTTTSLPVQIALIMCCLHQYVYIKYINNFTHSKAKRYMNMSYICLFDYKVFCTYSFIVRRNSFQVWYGMHIVTPLLLKTWGRGCLLVSNLQWLDLLLFRFVSRNFLWLSLSAFKSTSFLADEFFI